MAIKILRNLRSLLPIPRKWDEEGKSFALRIEDAYKWLQTQQYDIDTGKTNRIFLGPMDNTWEKIWDKLNAVNSGEAAVIFITGGAGTTPLSILTGGQLTANSHAGVVYRTSKPVIKFHLGNTANDAIEATLANASSTSAGTFSYRSMNGQVDTLSGQITTLTGQVAGKAGMLYLTSTENTWAKIWAKLNGMTVGETWTFCAEASQMSILSGGARENTTVGTISRITTNAFCMIYRMSTQYMFYGRITNATASSAGTFEEEMIARTGNLADLSTSSKTNLVSAINEVNGKFLKDAVMGPRLASQHKFAVPNNSGNLVIFTGAGTTYTWIGYVAANSTGTVTVLDIMMGSGIQSEGTSQNRLSITTSASINAYTRCINVWGGVLSHTT